MKAGSARSAPGADWLSSDRAALAANRILDVAERLFVDDGVDAVTMRQVAGAVGCSRATLYRYFPSREALHLAYVDRAARQVAQQVAAAAHRGERSDGKSAAGERSDDGPDHPMLVAITTALAGVRANPALAAWFTPGAAGTATDLALLSPTIEQIVVEFLSSASSSSEASTTMRAHWLVRVIVSFLTRPADSAEAEEQLLRAFVLPVL